MVETVVVVVMRAEMVAMEMLIVMVVVLAMNDVD